MKSPLILSRTHWWDMVHDITQRKKEEACGVIAGKNNLSLAVFPVVNILHSPVQYRMDPEQQLECLMKIEENGWDLLAIYHSHPGGLEEPSVTDLNEAYYPGVVHLIWYQDNGEWGCQGYLISKGAFEKVTIRVLEEDSGQPA